MKSQARGQPISLLVFSLLVCKFSMKGVGEGLELGAVVGDRHVALRSVPELRFELESPMLFVVAEEVLDGVPDDACCGAGTHDDAEELGGDGAVNPRENGVVIAAPIGCWRGVGGGGVGIADNMRGETIAA